MKTNIKIKYEDIVINGVAIFDEDGSYEIFFIHPMTGSWVQDIRKIESGWSFRDRENQEKLGLLFQLWDDNISEIEAWVSSLDQEGETLLIDLKEEDFKIIKGY